MVIGTCSKKAAFVVDMCGILGFSGSFDPAALNAGLRAIAHRGPDDAGVFFDAAAGVGLGHARLSIIDLSPLGHQPMLDSSGAAVIVFNGEIYNFRSWSWSVLL